MCCSLEAVQQRHARCSAVQEFCRIQTAESGGNRGGDSNLLDLQQLRSVKVHPSTRLHPVGRAERPPS